MKCFKESTGSEQEEDHTTGGLLQTRCGPTTQSNDHHNPIGGRGCGRGQYGGRGYYPNYDPNQEECIAAEVDIDKMTTGRRRDEDLIFP